MSQLVSTPCVATVKRVDRTFTREGALVWNPADPLRMTYETPATDTMAEGFHSFDIKDVEMTDNGPTISWMGIFVSFETLAWYLQMVAVTAAKEAAIDAELEAMLAPAAS